MIAPIRVLETRPVGAVARYYPASRSMEVGPDLRHAAQLSPAARTDALHTLAHEIGHAFEDPLDLTEATFTALLGHYEFGRGFVAANGRFGKAGYLAASPERTFRNPSEAVASLFADLVVYPAALTMGQRRWFKARLVELPEWGAAIEALRRTDLIAILDAGHFPI
jgi:hypothetical protein